MIPKSGHRFSEEIMLQKQLDMIPKSGHRFSEEIMLQQKFEIVMAIRSDAVVG